MHLQDVEHLPGVGGDKVPQLGLVRQLREGRISELDLVRLGQGHQPGRYPGLVIILQLITARENRTGQEPGTRGGRENRESFVSQLLVNLTELLQFLVETEIIDGCICSDPPASRPSWQSSVHVLIPAVTKPSVYLYLLLKPFSKARVMLTVSLASPITIRTFCCMRQL